MYHSSSQMVKIVSIKKCQLTNEPGMIMDRLQWQMDLIANYISSWVILIVKMVVMDFIHKKCMSTIPTNRIKRNEMKRTSQTKTKPTKSKRNISRIYIFKDKIPIVLRIV